MRGGEKSRMTEDRNSVSFRATCKTNIKPPSRLPMKIPRNIKIITNGDVCPSHHIHDQLAERIL